jgi:ribokinase
MGRVFVVGSLHLDVVLNAPHLPRLDETLIGSGVRYVFGGKGGNQAIAAARMGAITAMAGRIGQDAFGATLLATLEHALVDPSQIQRGQGASGMSAAIVDANGDYGAVVVSAANLEIEADKISVPHGTDILCLQNEIPEAANLAVAQYANGARVILNGAPARALPDPLVALIDILIVNRIEAEDLTGLNLPENMARALAARGVQTVIVTLGADGLVLCDGAQILTMSAIPTRVVSTHGAGDMFVGALAAELAEGADLHTALIFAQQAASLHVGTAIDMRAGLNRRMVQDALTG